MPAVILITAVLLLGGCAPAYLSRKAPIPQPTVRVAVGHGLDSVRVAGQDTVYVSDGVHLGKIAPGESWTVFPDGVCLKIATSRRTIIAPAGPNLKIWSSANIQINYMSFLWPLSLLCQRAGALLLVAEIPLEDYLIGVLSKEMGNAGEAEIEALKAQAVAARSYALTKIDSNRNSDYDLEADVAHQAFDPWVEGSPAIRKAVEKTRGQVLCCRGKPFVPNYHSTCGGRTALPSEVWGTADSLFPWAKSVKCEYCRISPRFRWKVDLASGELARRALGLADTTIPITDIRIEARSPSGRVQRLRIGSQAGDTVLFRDRILFQLAEKILPSTWFDINCRRDELGNVASVEFTGKGYGHGVGLCQWGAIGMAREGKKYKKILKKFYHNSVICKVY